MPRSDIALITGITGQDGSYLTELLLEKGYAVHGVVRRTSNLTRSRIEHLRSDGEIYGKRLFLHYGDLSDGTTLRRIFAEVEPTEVRPSLCYSPNLPDEGRGRESQGVGDTSGRPPKVKGLRKQSESLRQKDRGPEGVLESSI